MKKLTLTLAALALTITASFTSFAGEWKQDGSNWKYLNDDGTYSTNTWQWIDGNADNICEKYYFDENSILLVNTTAPDGSSVDTNGAWIVDGVVQSQAVTAVLPATQTTSQAAVPPAETAVKNTGISTTAFDGYTIVVNTNTKKYHYPSCSSVKDMKAENIGYSSDSAYLEANGYVPCKRCH